MWYVVSFIAGGLVGVIFMAMFQIEDRGEDD